VKTLAALLLVLLAAAAAEAAGPRDRTEALAALDDRDVETRRLGAAALAERGTMEDVDRLVQALRDADPLVRAIAERSLWGCGAAPATPRSIACWPSAWSR